MKALTEKQQNTLNYLKEHLNNEGRIPSLLEVAKHFGDTPHAIHQRLNAIEKKEYIERIHYHYITIHTG